MRLHYDKHNLYKILNRMSGALATAEVMLETAIQDFERWEKDFLSPKKVTRKFFWFTFETTKQIEKGSLEHHFSDGYLKRENKILALKKDVKTLRSIYEAFSNTTGSYTSEITLSDDEANLIDEYMSVDLTK